jgi:methyl-accepting chemotaxis protein
MDYNREIYTLALEGEPGMKIIINRTVGFVLIVAALAGILFNLAGVVYVWTQKDRVTENVVSTIQLVNTTMETTVQALDVAKTSLETSITSVTSVEATLNTTAETIETSEPMMATLAELMKNDLPTTLSSTQTSLIAAQDSARIIDTVLRALTSIPFVSNDLYNPPVPLHVALGQVSDSLDGLPKSFTTMGDSLTAASGNMQTMQTDVTLIATNIDTIQTSLESAQKVISQYRTLVADLDERLDRSAERVPAFIDTSAWVLTFVFVWLGLTQIGLLFQGMEMLGYALG